MSAAEKRAGPTPEWMRDAAHELYCLFPFGQAPHQDAIVAILERFAPVGEPLPQPSPPPTIPFGVPIPATINGEPGRVAFFSKEAARAYGFQLAEHSPPSAAKDLLVAVHSMLVRAEAGYFDKGWHTPLLVEELKHIEKLVEAERVAPEPAPAPRMQIVGDIYHCNACQSDFKASCPNCDEVLDIELRSKKI